MNKQLPTPVTEQHSCPNCHEPYLLDVASASWENAGPGEWVEEYMHFGPGTITVQKTSVTCNKCLAPFDSMRALFEPDKP